MICVVLSVGLVSSFGRVVVLVDGGTVLVFLLEEAVVCTDLIDVGLDTGKGLISSSEDDSSDEDCSGY